MNDRTTWEEAVYWLKSNYGREVIEACYFHDKPIDAAKAYLQSDEFKSITKYLPLLKNKRILDVGAGNGIASYAFSKLGANVVAIEPDPSDFVGAGAIRRLNAELSNKIEVHQTFGESTKLKENSFDIIFARQVVHHAQSMNDFFTEMHRLIKPNGIMLTIRDHVVRNEVELEAFFNNHLLHHKYGGEYAYSEEEYEAALSQAGFSIGRKIESLENIINYFPASAEETKMIIRGELRKQLKWASFMFSRYLPAETVIKLFGRIASKSYHVPGRLISYKLIAS